MPLHFKAILGAGLVEQISRALLLHTTPIFQGTEKHAYVVPSNGLPSPAY